MVIRTLTPADVPAITAINAVNVPAVGAETIESMERLLGLCSLALAVVVTDTVVSDEIAGFCYVLAPGVDYDSLNYRWFSERYDSFAYLDRVAFGPAHQGRGFGAALYAEVETRLAGTADWFTLEVNVEPRNEGSLRFHSRLGFVEVGQQDTGPGKRVSLMAKPFPTSGASPRA